jgi:arylsulfatase A-like enzyme
MTNVVLITADNQPPGLLGCYGNNEVHTPHIDQLAEDGVLLSRFFCTNGMCSPGRASMLTGLMPSQHGVHSWLRDADLLKWPDTWSAIEEFESLPTALKKLGYKTAMVGKHHLGQPHVPIPGFDETVTFVRGHTEDFYDNQVIDRGSEYPVTDRHIVDFFTEKAVDYVASSDNSPFFLMVNYDAPYLLPPTNLGPDYRNRFYEMFVGKKFDTFPRTAISDEMLRMINGPDDPDRYARHMLYNLIRMHNDPASMANVCAQIAIVDDGVGQIVAALREKDLLDNTIVIYTADQANLYGQHGLWGHTIQTRPSHLYEAAVHIPFIVRHPMLRKGVTRDGLCSQIDLPATVLDMLGQQHIFANSAGQSFKEHLLSGSSFLNPVFFEQEESRGMRTDRYSYWCRIPGAGPEVLYDHQHDPHQTTNVAADAQYADVVTDLRGRVTAFFEQNSTARYDLWQGGQAKGSISSETYMRPLMPPGWVATTTHQ